MIWREVENGKDLDFDSHQLLLRVEIRFVHQSASFNVFSNQLCVSWLYCTSPHFRIRFRDIYTEIWNISEACDTDLCFFVSLSSDLHMAFFLD